MVPMVTVVGTNVEVFPARSRRDTVQLLHITMHCRAFQSPNIYISFFCGVHKCHKQVRTLKSLLSNFLPRRAPSSARKGVSAIVSATTKKSSLTSALDTSPFAIASPLYRPKIDTNATDGVDN